MLMITLGKTPFPKRRVPRTAILFGCSQKLTRNLLFVFFLMAMGNMAIAQTFRINGKVTQQPTGTPLSGATVTVKGSTASALTNTEGSFSIQAPRQEVTLIISYIGFTPKEIKANSQTELNISLQPATNSLNEVVVVGYGTAKRKDLTGAVASVSGKQLAAVPVANAAQALQGKLPGVTVTSQDGRPGASVSIRVRGGSSISQSNEPLYIVDGFPVGNISDIPASQIESIDVLKDASSTAIYGARGANGVIIVTTKSGKSGKLTINYDNYLQYNQPIKYLETMSAYDYVAYNWGYARAISDNYANAWEQLWGIGRYTATYNNTAGIDHYKNVAAKNYSKEAYTSSFSHNHNISVGNGNATTKYLLSMSYLDDDGMKINSWFKRANASFKLDQKLSKKLNLAFDTRYTDIQRMGSEGTSSGRGSILSSSYQFRPIATSDVLGELDDRKNTQLGLYDLVLQDQFNPVELMKDYMPLSKDRSMRTNASLAYTPINGLTLKSEFGLNKYWNRGKTWSGAVYRNYIDPGTGNKTYAGDASISSSEGWGWRWVNYATYQVPFLGDAHSLNITAGEEVQNSGSESISMYGNKYPVSFTSDRAFAMMDQYLNVPNVVNSGYSSSVGTPSRINSYFGRANYTLMDKYLFSATFRADGSSRFSPLHRWGYFPAASIGWRLSDEAFMKNITWLDNLKVRASYGEVGNDGISANLWIGLWTSSGLTRYSINEAQQAAYNPASTKPNPDLKWETSITRNIGADFSLFNRRLTGTIDVYKNSSNNLLMYTTLPAITGYAGWYQNVGGISNKGIEFSLASDLIHTNDFSLSANFNINFNRGRVEKLAPGINGLYNTGWGSVGQKPNTGDYILQVGKAVGQVRGFTYDGWYTPDDFDYANGVYTLKKGVADISSGLIGTVYGTNANKPGGQVAYPGVIKFKDLNGDGTIDEKDVQIIGDMNPKHTGGFSLNSSYKNFDLALNFNWTYGNQVYNANYLAAFYGSKEDGLYRNRFDYLSTTYKIYDIRNGQLTFVTDPNELKALNANATTFLPYHENPIVSTMGIQDGSYLRLNTVTLGYNLPENLIRRAKLSRLRIYGSIYNALTFTSYPGLDPEVNTNSGMGGGLYPTIGLDWGAYPRARSFTAGLNVGF